MWLPSPRPGEEVPPTRKKRRPAQRSHNRLYSRPGRMEEGGARVWAPHGHPTGTATAGRGAQASRRNVHAHIRSWLCMRAHTPSEAPPTPLLYPPAHPSAVGTIRRAQKKGWWWVAGSPSAWRQACCSLCPLTAWPCREGSQPHTRHPTAGRGNGCCAW